MQRTLALLILSLPLVAEAEVHSSSGKVIEEDRKVSAFSEVSVSSGLHTTIVPGSAISVKVKGEASIVPLVETSVSSGTLNIRMKKSKLIHISDPIEIMVTMPTLKKVEASGGSHLTSTTAIPETLSVESSGGSHVTVTEITAKSLKVDGSGGSLITLKGKTGMLVFEGSGGTQLQADDLESPNTSIDASGGTQVHVKKSTKIKADISGGSMVFAEKSAQIEAEKSGGSEVVKQ